MRNRLGRHGTVRFFMHIMYGHTAASISLTCMHSALLCQHNVSQTMQLRTQISAVQAVMLSRYKGAWAARAGSKLGSGGCEECCKACLHSVIHVVHLGYNKLLLWELQAARSHLSTPVSCSGHLVHNYMQMMQLAEMDSNKWVVRMHTLLLIS